MYWYISATDAAHMNIEFEETKSAEATALARRNPSGYIGRLHSRLPESGVGYEAADKEISTPWLPDPAPLAAERLWHTSS